MFFSLSSQISSVSHIASTALVRFFVLLRLSSDLPPRTRPRSRPRSHPLHRSHLRYCSRFCPCSRPRSGLLFVHGSLLAFMFPSCLVWFAFTPVLVHASSPSPFKSPLTPPDPVPASVPALDSDPALSPIRFFPPPTPGTPSMQYVFTATRPYERSCWMPASATPGLQRL